MGEFDDDIMGGNPEKGGDGDLAYMSSYITMNIEEKVKNIKRDAEKYIDALSKFYLDQEKFEEYEYIKAIQDSEKNNLELMIKQIGYSSHILDTLMRQLENGGYVDPNLFTVIREMQESAMEITLKVSKYTRGLPDYFKFTNLEMQERHNIINGITGGENGDVNQHTQKTISINSQSGDVEDSKDGMFEKPIRGTRELMLMLQEDDDFDPDELNKAIERNDNVEDIEPIEIDDDEVDNKK